MSTTLWNSTITRIGIDAVEIIHSGVFILFGEPVPEALADVSIVHDRASSLARPLQAGDQFVFGGQTYVLDDVGGRASDNLTELGHVVIYVDQPDQVLLPGAIKASGPAPLVPEPGSSISFVEV